MHVSSAFFFVQFPSVAEGLAMSLSFQGTYCLTPGKYDSVSLSAEFDPFEISDLVQKKDVRLRATRDDRADAASGRGSVPGSASWSAVEGDGASKLHGAQ